MQTQRLAAERKNPLPPPHVGISAVSLLFGRDQVGSLSEEQMVARYNGLPILIDGSASVVALYFEPQARMDEHSNPRNTLFIVLRGSGWLRIGGPTGETRAVQAGDAILWPPAIDHMVWTDDESLEALVIEIPQP